MALSIKKVSLGEVCEIVSSKRIFASEYKREGIPFYRGKEISQLARGEQTTAELYISKEAYKGALSRTGPVNPGEILLTAVGTLGNPYQVQEKDLPFYFKDGNVLWLRKFSVDLNPVFFFYWLDSQHGRTKVLDTSIGSTQAALTISALNKVEISLPKLREQSVIVETLAPLDQKIGLNKAMSKTLEDIAQAIFKSWFIDFDPVKAKVAGEKPVDINDETASLFPDSFVESDLGDTPLGWEVVPSTDLFEILSGGTPKTSNDEYWNGEIPWFSVVDAPNSGGCFFIKTAKTITQEGLRNSAAKLVRPGITVISARGTVGKIAIAAAHSTFNQSCYGVEGKYGDFLTYLLLKSQISRLQNISHGGMFDTITRETFSSVFVAKPSLKLMALFESIVEPLFLEIRNLQHQNQGLREMRDALLPRLISGELQIPQEMMAS